MSELNVSCCWGKDAQVEVCLGDGRCQFVKQLPENIRTMHGEHVFTHIRAHTPLHITIREAVREWENEGELNQLRVSVR